MHLETTNAKKALDFKDSLRVYKCFRFFRNSLDRGHTFNTFANYSINQDSYLLTISPLIRSSRRKRASALRMLFFCVLGNFVPSVPHIAGFLAEICNAAGQKHCADTVNNCAPCRHADWNMLLRPGRAEWLHSARTFRSAAPICPADVL